MSNRPLSRVVKLALLLLMFTMQLHAADQNNFNKGQKLFASGDCNAAVKEFEQVLKQNNISAALYYNLASSYYKLGNYNKAYHYFSMVKKYTKIKSLAEYNLGLTALKQGYNTLSKKWFEEVVNTSSNKKLVLLARQQLKSDKLVKPEIKNWSGYLRGGIGHDDNINIAPTDTALKLSDNFYDLFASVEKVLKGSRKNGWLVEALFYNINYFDSSSYDESQYGVGVKNNAVYGKWKMENSIFYTA
jgi:tetratricopeptide (TPR) repeat protein